MRPDEFAKMRALEETNWWFRGRRYLLRRLISRLGLRDGLILDAGCGTGFARGELSQGGTVIGLDASHDALCLGLSDTPVACCVSSIESVPFPPNTFDLIVAMDLIEHLEAEAPALREMRRVCKPGGHLFITVPAYQSLWSRHDEALGHYRRYTTSRIADTVRAGGFDVQKKFSLVSTILPGAAIFRLLRRKLGRESNGTDLFPVPEPFNFILSLVMRAECALGWSIGLPFGLTACVLARKPLDGERTQ